MQTWAPPYNPVTNGAAEQAVQAIKKAVKKMGTDMLLNVQLM